jgi:hypothetical protein
VVRDDARRGPEEALAGPLDDLLDVHLGHRLPDLPVDHGAAAAVEEAAQVVEGAGEVQVRDVHVPVLVRREGLHEALALRGRLGVVPVREPGLAENAVDAGRATGHHVGVEHHEGQAPIPFQGVAGVEVDDGLFLRGFQPMVARDPGVVLVGLAVAVLPGVPLGGADADPEEEAGDGDAGLAGPAVDEVDEGVTGVVGNPGALQGSPRPFFSWTCSSISSARTPLSIRSLSSRAAILRSLASSAALRRLKEKRQAGTPDLHAPEVVTPFPHGPDVKEHVLSKDPEML